MVAGWLKVGSKVRYISHYITLTVRRPNSDLATPPSLNKAKRQPKQTSKPWSQES